MIDATSSAAIDAGAAALLGSVGWVGVAGGWFRYHNPGQLIAERIAVRRGDSALVDLGNRTAGSHRPGRRTHLLRPARRRAHRRWSSARWSQQRLKRLGQDPTWVVEPGMGQPESLPGFPGDPME